MGRTKQALKKALSIVSTAALLLTCGAAGTVAGIVPAGITAQAASAVATQLKVLDSDGKDLGDNPIIYLDTSEAGGEDSVYHNVTKTIKVVASNDSGVAVNDEIRLFTDSDTSKYVMVSAPSSGTGSITATLSGGGYKKSGDKNVWEEKKPGTTQLYFTTTSGEVYRTVTIVTYRPAQDMTVATVDDKGKSVFSLNRDNLSNACTIMTIANHKYQFEASMIPADSTDNVEWKVVEGSYENKSGETATATKKAEINADGLFTPKTNGTVTIIAKCKKTETTPRNANYGPKVYSRYNEETQKYEDVTIERYKNIPKYIHVVIVKENPAKALKITNAPSAMELNKTVQLKYEATPTYTGSGYESGATDEFKWKSSNPSVITVDDKGLIKAVGKGDATITVTGENDNVFAEANIRVITKASSISYNVKTLTTRVGNSETIKAVMYPATADEEIVWKSSNPKIATVKSVVKGAYTNEQSAVVTGVSKGVVTITARAKNSGVEANITCNVEEKIVSSTVKLTYEKDGKIINIGEGDTVSVYDQNMIVINGSLLSSDGASPDDTIVWKVIGNGENNSDYVDVVDSTSTELKLRGFAKGTVTVSASSKAIPSVKKTFKLQVLKRATRGTIFNKEDNSTNFHKNMNVGTKMQLGADLTIDSNKPYDHDDKVARWESDNKKAFTIDNQGNLKAVGNGSAMITMISESGYSLKLNVTSFTTSSVVIRNVTKTSTTTLPYADINLDNEMTGKYTLNANVFNENDKQISDVALKWTSDNEAVATVDENGVVTGRIVGTAKITVKSGSKTDSCIINVRYSMDKATIKLSNVYYSPKAQEYRPEVVVYAGNESVRHILKEGKDYSITYSNNYKVGDTATVVVTGMGSYSGTYTGRFTIVAKDINAGDVTCATISDQELTSAKKSSGGVKPELKIVHEGYRLVEGKDYVVTYSGNSVPGKATASVRGTGNYTGSFVANFNIYCNHEDCNMTVVTESTCTREGLARVHCNTCNANFDSVLPLKDHNYYASQTVAPTYAADGYTVYTCRSCGATEKRDYVPALERTPAECLEFTANKTVFVENGLAQKPDVSVKYGDKTLSANNDYTVSYSNSLSKKAGNYTVKIALKGEYTGTHTLSYTILPKASSISFSSKTLSLKVGESAELKVTTTPANAAGGVVWNSSNMSVAKVTEDGVVIAASKGTATITATSGDRTAKCELTVSEASFSNMSTLAEQTIREGEKATVRFEAANGKTPYQYGVDYKLVGASSWSTGAAYSKNTKASFKPSKEGNYIVRAKIKDGKGNVANKDMILVVGKALKNNSILKNNTISNNESTSIICKSEGGSGNTRFNVAYKLSTSSKWTTLQEYGYNKVINFTPQRAGTYNIKVKALDSSDTLAVKTLTLTVLKPLKNTSKASPVKVTLGGKISVTCSASGGTAPYTYKVSYIASKNNTATTLQSFSSNSKITFTPASAGYYTIEVIAKDSRGKESYKYIDVVAYEKITLTASSNTDQVTVGDSFNVSAFAKGGDGNFRYAFYTKKSNSTKWTTVKGFSYSNSASVIAASSGTYNVRVKVKDSRGTTTSTEFSVRVLKKLSNNSKLLSTKIIVGGRAVVTCKASGGGAPYAYDVSYRAEGTSEWITVQSFSPTAKVYVSPKKAGNYEVLVKVKDVNGTVVEKTLSFKAVDKLVNNSSISATSVKIKKPVTVTLAASGGDGCYTYYVGYVKAGTTKMVTLQNYAATKNITFSIKTAGTYTVKVKVKDAAGKIVIKKFSLTVTK